MARGKGLATAALALGLVGLFSLGGLGVGSLLGLALAVVALFAGPREGRDVAWAAVAANVFALLTLVPGTAAILTYRHAPFLFGVADDESLPTPAHAPLEAFVEPPPPPPPPPPRQGERPAPVRVGSADSIQEPRKTRHVPPAYPRDALAARIQGQVVLECTISAEGKVVEMKTLRGHPLLVESARGAVAQWEYEPSLLNGVAVPVVMTVNVAFTLR